MKKYYLQYKSKISLKKAIDKISSHATIGEHMFKRPVSKAETCNLLLSLGENPNEIAERCRDWKENVPYFENSVGPVWDFSGQGKAEIIDPKTNKPIAVITDPGTLSLSSYKMNFETACKAKNRAVDNFSYTDFQTAIVHGIASIEGYITELAKDWNHKNPSAQLIDSKQKKVSMDNKFDLWIPKITSGKKIKKQDRCWRDFIMLRQIRDNETIHAKHGGQAISYKKLADNINSFRWGIAGLLGSLHRLAEQWIPSVVINAFFMPDVEVIEEDASI
jgi:hypothetical protein